jgi:Zn-dependent peptidase ImmA (M78 family)
MTATRETLDAELQARSILDRLGVSAPGPLNLAPVARAFGAEIFECSLDDCSAKLVWSSTGWHIIRVDVRDCLERRNFSAAHEIGHLVRRPGGPVECAYTAESDRSGDGDDEQWANEFAAALLMPKHLLEPLFVDAPATMATAKRLRRLCGVSRTAATARLPALMRAPSLFVRHAAGRATWIERSPALGAWTLRDGVARGSAAFSLIETNTYTFGPEPLRADVWFEGHGVERFVVVEDSTYCNGSVYTLLECVGRVGEVPATVAPRDPEATVIEYRKGRPPRYRRFRTAPRADGLFG